jgi:hypothetical protein
MSSSQILDDLAKMAGGTMSFVSSAREQVRQEIRSKIDDVAESMDLVPREDFERLEAMLQQARLKQEDLEKRLSALEEANKKPKKTAKSK